MTTTEHHPAAPAPALVRADVVAVLVVLAASVVIGLSALVAAPGATTTDGTTYDTQYVLMPLWLVGCAVLAPAAGVVAARRGGVAAAGATLAVVVPQTVVAALVVVRYQLGGWGSGLEVFVFGVPLLLALVTSAAVGLGLLARPLLRHRAARRRP